MPIANASLRPDDEANWPCVYLVIATAGLVILGLKSLNVFVIGDASGFALAAVFLVAFAIASLFHWRAASRRTDDRDEENHQP